MRTSEPKHRAATSEPTGGADLHARELEYWMKKRQALILELTALEKHMLPHLLSPVWRLIEEEKERTRPRR